MTLKRTIYPIAIIALLVACKTKKKKDNITTTATVQNTIANNSEPEETYTYDKVAGTVNFEDMDPSVNPRTDFYEYANGNWLKNNPVPPTEERWGSFNVLVKENNEKLKHILEKCSMSNFNKGDYRQLVGDYYYTFMDSIKRNKDGIEPIKDWIKKIDQLKTKKEIAALVANMHNYGISPFFELAAEQDLKDVNRYAVYANQAGMRLPSKDYYLKKDSKSEEIRNEYVMHISRLMIQLGYKKPANDDAAKNILNFETNLADAAMSPVELRNIEAQYNVMSVDELINNYTEFDWKNYMNIRGLKGINEIIVGQPKFFEKLNTLINQTPLNILKDYLKWHLIANTATKLTDELEKESFYFNNTILKGAKEMKPRWERAIAHINWTAVSEPLGHAFVDIYFKPEAKQKVNEMVDNIMKVFEERLDKLEWMSEETKQRALKKLASFERKLGYPDKWTDFSELTITRESLIKNWLNSNYFLIKKNLEKLNKPIDRSEWQMAPHIVNAYYNPLWNEIVFPAGIMQPPFFDINAEDVVNYARMGAVIGHEFTHGFDDQGAQFDHTGAFVNWWTEDDQKKFNQRTAKLVEHYNEFEPINGLFVNGELTLGENIADLGGVTLAYYAYKRSAFGKKRTKINGFTPEQRFFIAYAQIWKSNYTESAMRNQVLTNPHSPSKYRVNGPLANMPEFFEIFHVKEGEAMRRLGEKIAKIW